MFVLACFVVLPLKRQVVAISSIGNGVSTLMFGKVEQREWEQ